MPQYKPSGSFPLVNVTNGSATVVIQNVNAVGSVLAGHNFFVSGANSGRYEVGSVAYSAPNTNVTLTTVYSGASATGATGVFHSEFSANLSLPLVSDNDLEFAALNRRQMQLLDATYGNLGAAINVSGGNVGIGTTTPTARLDVCSGSVGLVVGADNGTSTRTNLTTKLARIGAAHYNNTEEPVGLIIGNSTSSTNEVYIGGGSSSVNSATHIIMYTSSNNTSVTGNQRMVINSAGNVGIAATDPQARLHLVGPAAQARFDVSTATDARHEYHRNGVIEGQLQWDANLVSFGAVQSGGSVAIWAGGQTARLRINSNGNIGINTATIFGSGVGVVGIANATTAPTTNPTGGGVLYVEAGALRYRGSSGTVTTLAAA